MNRIILIGRLTAEPELKYTKSSIAVSSFTLAVDRRFKNKDGEKEADFINIVVWRQQAEHCANYLSKGSKCAVEGSLQIRSYVAKDGTKRYVAEVVADNVEFLDNKTTGKKATPTENKPFDEDAVGDDSLPF